MNLSALFAVCLAYASHGRRMQSIPREEGADSKDFSLEALSALLQTSKPEAAWQVAGSGLSHVSAMKKPMLVNSAHRTAAVKMEEAEATLEEQLKEGLITQEEYDMLSSAVEEDEYLAEVANEPEAELSQEAKDEKARLSGPTGVEFAPWMKIDPEAIAKAKKDRAARLAQQASSTGKKRVDQAFVDPIGAEQGAIASLKDKVISEEEVELRWETKDEADNYGYIVQRRPGRTEDWVTIASYEETAQLRTKGPSGGQYVYLDDTVKPGNWVYRIIDETSEGRSVVTQKLVEIETKEELLRDYGSIAAVFIIIGIAAFFTLQLQPNPLD
mmetsp:Transcript_43680/g.72582  ORF Transcript_43680/g.72582 Transcript_43680/m.72582 type:complete len:328 (-) Transcript_43680:241-1224(-)